MLLNYTLACLSAYIYAYIFYKSMHMYGKKEYISKQQLLYTSNHKRGYIYISIANRSHDN